MIVFLVLLALLAGGIYLVNLARGGDREEPPATPAVSPEAVEDHSLTDAEAIARFKELDALRLRALEERRAQLLLRAFTSDSPAGDRLRESIRTLKAQRAFADERSKWLDLRIVRNSVHEIEVIQVLLVDVRFFDKGGRDITRTGRRERQRVKWTLRMERSEWLLHDAVIESARPA